MCARVGQGIKGNVMKSVTEGQRTGASGCGWGGDPNTNTTTDHKKTKGKIELRMKRTLIEGHAQCDSTAHCRPSVPAVC